MAEGNPTIVTLTSEDDGEFEEDGVIEQLLITNNDLSIECEELKKKLNETNSSLAILEENMENLRAAKLRETEKSNSLAEQLSLSEEYVMHLEQVVRIRKKMSESSSVRSDFFRPNTSLGLESSSVRSGPIRNNASQQLVSVVAKMKQKMRQTSEKEPDQSQDGSFRHSTYVGLESSSLLSGSIGHNASLAGSYRQNNSERLESSSLPTASSFSPNAVLGLESTSAKMKQILRPGNESRKLTELKIDQENLASTFATEVINPSLSPTVLIEEKVNSDKEVSKMVSEDVIFKSSINFDEMDDDEFCQYQLNLMLAKENKNENPEELEADIEEVNKLFNLPRHSRRVQESLTVPSRPCSVKFLSRGWGMTLTKARAYFTSFHGVTGVKVNDAIVVVNFNTPEDAWAVIDRQPHVVSGCQLVPGPVTVLEDEDGAAEEFNMEDELANGIVPASQRTVEFFMTGEDINEEIFKSMPGVESFSVHGKRVKLVYEDLKMSEDVLNKGFVEVEGVKMTVGREGQLGFVEIKVAGVKGDIKVGGSKGEIEVGGEKGEIKEGEDKGEINEAGFKAVVDVKRLTYLLQDAGLSPVLDIQASAREGGIFGIVLENAKAKKLIKKGKLRLGNGYSIEVIGEKKQLSLDLGEGEELAGKMIMSSDTEESSVFSQLRSIREKKDLNHNIIEESCVKMGLKNEITAKHPSADSLNLTGKCPGGDGELRNNEKANLSLGCSSAGSADEDEDDCVQNSEQSVNKSIVQVIRMKLAPRSGLKCEGQSVSSQDLQEPSLSDQNLKKLPVEDEDFPVNDQEGYRSLNWSSCGSLNDSVEDEDSEDEEGKSDQVMGNNAVEVVRIVLAKN